jgi:hypothetical protein
LGLIGQPIALHDVANAEAFVQRALSKCGIAFSYDEREVLLAEGLTILYELAAEYRPLAARAGVDSRGGRFSGYAAMFLPRRLGDAWHKMHPEHRYVTDPETGERGWRYEAPMLSLDALTSSSNSQDAYGGERHLLHARPFAAFCHASAGRQICVSN